MHRFVTAACGLWLACASAVSAENVVVMELYTSQGCSSCPPADEYIAMLASDPRIVPLALHVDYWDYIGWADKFAQPSFTKRQEAYASAIGSRTIYTPQLIIGGKDRVEGYSPDVTGDYLKEHLSAEESVKIELKREGDTLFIRAATDTPLDEGVRVQLVRYIPEETVSIERGENAGQTITYHNIVTSWESIGEWGGRDPLEMTVPVEGALPVVVILQKGGPSSIVAAARLE
jgi:hypothetical protein